MDRWAIIDQATNAWVEGPLDADPSQSIDATQYVVLVPSDFPTGCFWVQGLDRQSSGFRDVIPPVLTPLMSVGRFKLLLTKDERVAIRAAAASSADVEDFLDLLNGFTDGVSLADPVLASALNEMVAAGLLTTDRVTAILAGQIP